MTSPAPPSSGHPSDTRSPPVKPGEELAGKYRIERVVGAGAMGVVVEARHIELDQQVAVKFLYPEFARNADGAERFRREARAVVKIRNDHVARVLDVGTLVEKGIPFIVMEYLHGRDLARELAERGTLPVQEAVRHILQACEAVAEAHRQGIVHRDLKPANLFLAQGSQGQRMIKVLDFGISKVNGQGSKQFSLTDTATLMGSPAYMSPEQLESSRNVDGRSDIWSLGVILHELILGAVPFTGESVPQLVRAILLGARTSLADRDPELWQLEQVVARCLQQDRAERYQDIEELCAALHPLTDATSAPLGASSAQPATSGHSSTARGVGGAGSEPSFDPHPAPSATESHTSDARADESSLGAGGVQSAWGHTQRGKGRPFRRGAPVLAGLLVIGAGVYWALMPSLSGEPAPSHLGAGTAPLELGQSGPAAVPPAAEPAPSPQNSAQAAPASPPPPAAGGADVSASQPRVTPLDQGDGRPAQPPRSAENERAQPERSAQAPAAPSAPARAPAARRAQRPAPGAVSAPAEAPASRAPNASSASEPSPKAPEAAAEGGERSKPEPARRDGLDIPDFGGRE